MNREPVFQPPVGSRPEPVMDAAVLAGAVSGLVVAVGAALIVLGFATQDDVMNWATIAGGIVTSGAAVVAALMPIWRAYKARPLVTPLADPRDAEGRDLVPLNVPGQP